MSVAISAGLVKELRDKTGAGVMECRNALDEAGGDMDKAIAVLQKRGVALAEKRGERETS